MDVKVQATSHECDISVAEPQIWMASGQGLLHRFNLGQDFSMAIGAEVVHDSRKNERLASGSLGWEADEKYLHGYFFFRLLGYFE